MSYINIFTVRITPGQSIIDIISGSLHYI